MTQHVIDVDGVPTLFSPVPAHALEPGDLVTDADGDSVPWRTPYVETFDGVTFIEFDGAAPGERGYGIELGANAPVLRAVGARAARGGAR